MDRSFIFAVLAGVSLLFLSVAPAIAGDGSATTVNSAPAEVTMSSSTPVTFSKKKNCDKLMQKALRTGRHYWWARYRKCLQRARKS